MTLLYDGANGNPEHMNPINDRNQLGQCRPLNNTPVELYEAHGVSAEISCVTICNTSVASAMATVHAIDNGEAPSEKNRIGSSWLLPAHTSIQDDTIRHLRPGGKIVVASSTGDALTFTIDGEEFAADVFHQLAQARPTAADTVTDLLSPNGVSYDITSVTICNTSGAAALATVYIAQDGVTFDDSTATARKWLVAAGSSTVDDALHKLGIGGKIKCESSVGGALTFTIEGSEVSLYD